MKTLTTLMICFIISNMVYSQDDSKAFMSNKTDKYYIGIDTGSEIKFKDVLTFINQSDGVVVIDYCEINNIVKITFSKVYFEELASILDLIERKFDGALCYKMSYTNDEFNTICYEEVVKRNRGGVE